MKSILKNKHSSEMTIGTIVIIVLALVVLAFLIFALARGTGSLNEFIMNLFGAGYNTDAIKNACAAACTSSSVEAFCEQPRILKNFDGNFKGSCATFIRDDKGIEQCSSITCTNFPKKCSDLMMGGNLRDSLCDTKTEENLFSKVGDSESKNIKKFQYCCKSKITSAGSPPLPPIP
jgi:hypothetical protein